MNRLGSGLIYGALLVLFVLHNDPWVQSETGQVLGLPVGLMYHVAICVAASVILALLVRHAWPRHLDAGGEDMDAKP